MSSTMASNGFHPPSLRCFRYSAFFGISALQQVSPSNVESVLASSPFSFSCFEERRSTPSLPLRHCDYCILGSGEASTPWLGGPGHPIFSRTSVDGDIFIWRLVRFPFQMIVLAMWLDGFAARWLIVDPLVDFLAAGSSKGFFLPLGCRPDYWFVWKV